MWFLVHMEIMVYIGLLGTGGALKSNCEPSTYQVTPEGCQSMVYVLHRWGGVGGYDQCFIIPLASMLVSSVLLMLLCP
jgi:hypothetical protein